MGLEGYPDDPNGLCNALLVAERNATFLHRMLAEYRAFEYKNSTAWGEFSVVRPARLAAAHPDEVHVMGTEFFFWPLCKR